nr:MAG TPA: hypothetical protein [Caudoviricetes sp.]
MFKCPFLSGGVCYDKNRVRVGGEQIGKTVKNGGRYKS